MTPVESCDVTDTSEPSTPAWSISTISYKTWTSNLLSYRLNSERASETEAGYLQTTPDGLDRMEQLITETLPLARKGAAVGEWESVDLGNLARSAWETVNPTDGTLVVERDRLVLADESRFRQLFEDGALHARIISSKNSCRMVVPYCHETVRLHGN